MLVFKKILGLTINMQNLKFDALNAYAYCLQACEYVFNDEFAFN